MGLKCLLIAMQTAVRLNHLYIMGSLLVSSARVASMINYMNELCFMNYRNIMESSCKPIDVWSSLVFQNSFDYLVMQGVISWQYDISYYYPVKISISIFNFQKSTLV